MTNSPHSRLITILGPTASGKTSLAVKLCAHFGGEVISADSRQVYRGMDLGTGKDLIEYQDIPYHLIDVADPKDEFNLFSYCESFTQSFRDIAQRGKLPFLVGGTGMYLDAILNRYNLTIAKIDENARQDLENKPESELIELLLSFDKNLHNTTDLTDRNRLIRAIEIEQSKRNGEQSLQLPSTRPLTIGIRTNRDEVKQSITKRLKERLKEGMIEEVERLRHEGLSWEKLHYFGLEYRFIGQYLKGELNYNDMFQKLNSAIHAFSKQQSKWFRNIEKKGHTIHWIDKGDNLLVQSQELIEQFLLNSALNNQSS